MFSFASSLDEMLLSEESPLPFYQITYSKVLQEEELQTDNYMRFLLAHSKWNCQNYIVLARDVDDLKAIFTVSFSQCFILIHVILQRHFSQSVLGFLPRIFSKLSEQFPLEKTLTKRDPTYSLILMNGKVNKSTVL